MRKIRWIVGLAIIFFAGGILILKLSGSGDFYITPEELKQRNLAPGELVRVGGRISQSSARFEGSLEGTRVIFNLSDSTESLPVVYKGSIPSTFRDGAEAVAEGTLNEKGVFRASRVLVKCPSNFLPEKAVGVLLKDTRLESWLYR